MIVFHKEKFIQQKQQCKFLCLFHIQIICFLFRNNETFHAIFASRMKQDYLIYPSMIGTEPGVIYIEDGYTGPAYFDESHPLTIPFDRCHELNLCIWYVSPIWQLKDYPVWALLMDEDKWAGINKQRFISIIRDIEKNQVTITAQGVFNSDGQLRLWPLQLHVTPLHFSKFPL
jgi:hypothetical protein